MLLLDKFKKVEEDSMRSEVRLQHKNATGAVVNLIAIQNLGMTAKIELREDDLPVYVLMLTAKEKQRLAEEMNKITKKVVTKEIKKTEDYIETDEDDTKTETEETEDK